MADDSAFAGRSRGFGRMQFRLVDVFLLIVIVAVGATIVRCASNTVAVRGSGRYEVVVNVQSQSGAAATIDEAFFIACDDRDFADTLANDVRGTFDEGWRPAAYSGNTFVVEVPSWETLNSWGVKLSEGTYPYVAVRFRFNGGTEVRKVVEESQWRNTRSVTLVVP